jgi:hypothetical protein
MLRAMCGAPAAHIACGHLQQHLLGRDRLGGLLVLLRNPARLERGRSHGCAAYKQCAGRDIFFLEPGDGAASGARAHRSRPAMAGCSRGYSYN